MTSVLIEIFITSLQSKRDKMDVLNPECAAQSVGPANQLFGLLIQTILAAQCAISPKDMWPKDYGPTALEQGKIVKCLKHLLKQI